MAGASRADQSFRSCGTSLSISYVLDKDEVYVYLSKINIRSFITNIRRNQLILYLKFYECIISVNHINSRCVRKYVILVNEEIIYGY